MGATKKMGAIGSLMMLSLVLRPSEANVDCSTLWVRDRSQYKSDGQNCKCYYGPFRTQCFSAGAVDSGYGSDDYCQTKDPQDGRPPEFDYDGPHDCTMVSKAKCNTYGTCPEGFIGKADQDQTDCAGATCDDDIDKDACCEAKAKCNTYGVSSDGTCPEGFTAKANKDKIECAGATCDKNTDKTTCCDANKAKCQTLTCPKDFVAKSSKGDTKCAGAECTEKDKDTCCEAAVWMPAKVSVQGITKADFDSKESNKEMFITSLQASMSDSLKDSTGDKTVTVTNVEASDPSSSRRRLLATSTDIKFTLVKSIAASSAASSVAKGLADALESAVNGKLEEELKSSISGITALDKANFVKPNTYTGGDEPGVEKSLGSSSIGDALPTEALVAIVVLGIIFIIAIPLLLCKHSHLNDSGHSKKHVKQTHPMKGMGKPEPHPLPSQQHAGDCCI
jgi:hypothetical protein